MAGHKEVEVPKMPEGTALALRFANPATKLESVTIYDLGLSLVAVQRIVHKADLARKQQLRWGAKLPANRRRELALTVSGRVEGSDIWGITPVVSDPEVMEYLRTLISEGLKALTQYIAGKAVEQFSKDIRKAGPSLTVGVFHEVTDIANRVSEVGGAAEVELIAIAPDGTAVKGRVKFDAKARAAVNSARAERVLGPRRKLKGVVSRLYPNQHKAHIKAGRRYVHVMMEEDIFSNLRYNSKQGDVVTFHGCPVYRLGSSVETFREFDADAVTIPGREDEHQNGA